MCLCRDAPAGRLYDEQGRGLPGIEVGGLGNLSIVESEGGAGVQVGGLVEMTAGLQNLCRLRKMSRLRKEDIIRAKDKGFYLYTINQTFCSRRRLSY
jgi:hypothetical protein